MKRIYFIILMLLMFSCTAALCDQEYLNSGGEVPEGMEVITIGGGGQLIVPKGAKIKQVGAQVIVEGTKEYTARMVSELTARITQLEKSQQDLLQEISKLKQTIESLEKTVDAKKSSPEPEN